LKKILIIGASGLLGSALYHVLTKKYAVIGTYFSNSDQTSAREFLDVSDEASITLLLMRLKPDFVINCSGLTNVEECERLPEKAMLLNAIIPGFLARVTHQLQIKLVHISTDHFASEINQVRMKVCEHYQQIVMDIQN
jgi:dTDP-4-dehydrorhamnose reductase